MVLFYTKDFDPELMDGNQTRIHAGASDQRLEIGLFLVTHEHSLSYVSDVSTSNEAVAIAPDAVYSLNDEDPRCDRNM